MLFLVAVLLLLLIFSELLWLSYCYIFHIAKWILSLNCLLEKISSFHNKMLKSEVCDGTEV